MTIPVSESDLTYTTQTRGWTTILVPFWEKQKGLLRTKFEAVSRKSNDLTQLKYDRGFLDGYEAASNVVQKIKMGQQLKNRLSGVKGE